MRLSRRATTALATAGVALAGAVAFAAPALADPDADVEPQSVHWTTLKPGDSGAGVAGARCIVSELSEGTDHPYSGCFPDEDLGDYYDETFTEAVKDYQQDVGVEQTGEVDEATWERISDDVNTVATGDDREGIVVGLQVVLNEKNDGVDVEHDGKFGRDTEQAVETFQESVGYEPDGIVGPDTFLSLFGE